MFRLKDREQLKELKSKVDILEAEIFQIKNPKGILKPHYDVFLSCKYNIWEYSDGEKIHSFNVDYELDKIISYGNNILIGYNYHTQSYLYYFVNFTRLTLTPLSANIFEKIFQNRAK